MSGKKKTEKVEKKEKKAPARMATSLELLRYQDKAMQVGPQPHLRKKWSKVNIINLKGGVGS